ncbi:TPA: bacterial Ig-like domain-containing protein, partial [Enterococcus faecalis]
MKKSLIFFLLSCLLLNPGIVAFAEIDNNMSNESGLSCNNNIIMNMIEDYHLVEGDDFRINYPFISGIDECGNPFDYSRVQGNKLNNAPTVEGRYDYHYIMNNGQIGKSVVVYVHRVKRDGRRAKLKDDEVFVGEDWSLDRVFEDVRDKYGTRISGNTVKRYHSVVIDNIVNKQNIDTSRPGKHTVYIGIANPNTYPKVWSDTVTVTVKEDKTTVRLKDTELYVGEKWDPNSVFENVTDRDGNKLTADQVDYYWINNQLNRDIDTSKPGEYRVQVAVNDSTGRKKYGNEVKVTVKKKDQTSLKTRDSTIYVGQKWNPKDNFVSATDEVGKSVPWEDPRIHMNNANIDTSKPGIHKIKYTFKEKENIVDSS